MPFTPAHVAAIRGKLEKQQDFNWKVSVIKVKELYRERKYKRCARLCEETIAGNPTIHPLHKTFVLFHQALCYESLGLSAHNYSGYKLPFLHTSKDAFESAMDTLPLPFATDNRGHYETPQDSPAFEGSSSSYSNNGSITTTPITESPTPTPTISLPLDESFSFSNYTDADLDSEIFSVPDFYECSRSPRAIFDKEDTPEETTLKPRDSHKFRLSQSLSSKHVLNESLIPSPLSLRNSKTRPLSTTTTALTPRPLPPLPFNHHPTFSQAGARHIQIPKAQPQGLRRTALIPQGFYDLTPKTTSPITPRFNMIHDAFDPILSPDDYLRSYLSSRSLARFNAYLSDFRTQLFSHIQNIEVRIHDTETLQHEHAVQKEKEHGNGRVASYWLLRPISPSLTRPFNRGEVGTPKTTSSAKTLTRHGGDKSDKMTDEKKKARVERLRECGWSVRKERHGFKGVEYYADLERKVLLELRT